MIRKKVKCLICKKIKQHFGKNLCSSCLRTFKRRTKPIFYLGTCYSEITRRCNHYDKKRPKYYKLKKCTKNEFINKFLNDKQFLKLFKLWQKNKYLRKFAPSIDRINSNKDYQINNLQFIQQNKNSVKDISMKVHIYLKNKSLGIYESLNEADRRLFKRQGYFWYLINKNNYTDYKVILL